MILRSIIHYAYLQGNKIIPNYAKINTAEAKAALWSNFRSSAAFPKVAFLCDEMTWQDFKNYTNSIFLHPKLWKKQLDTFMPDMIFCEATWSGIELFENVWRARVYKDHRVFFENRKELLHIIQYCKENGILTVFWSKEDPTYFNHPIYDFTQTALMFDVVLTTAEECVDKYYKMGHENVYIFPFGVNIEQYNINNYNPVPNSAIFAGSWFGDQKERCMALEKLLDYAIAENWNLDIYNRKSNNNAKGLKSPKKYTTFLKNDKTCKEMPYLLKKYQYAINVNTVTKSSSMCSRRLLQLTSSGNTVITNWSNVIENLEKYIYIENIIDNDIYIIKGNYNLDNFEYSTENQFENLCEKLGVIEKETILAGN